MAWLIDWLIGSDILLSQPVGKYSLDGGRVIDSLADWPADWLSDSLTPWLAGQKEGLSSLLSLSSGQVALGVYSWIKSKKNYISSINNK